MLQLAIVFTAIFGVKLRRPIDMEEQIVGGKPETIEAIPYQAALYYRNFFICSGSVVTSVHILTAGHCLTFLLAMSHKILRNVIAPPTGDKLGKYLDRPANPGDLSVAVGSTYIGEGGLLLRAKKFDIHPKFSRRVVDYDVAVIHLLDPIKSNAVKAIKLTDTEPAEGEQVRVSGWGYISETGPPSLQLQSTIVEITNRKSCEKSYQNRIKITERMICAMGDGKDACYGDSGGPLVHRDTQVGIVSSGEGCAKKEYAGIYTNVANKEIHDFIVQKTEMCNEKSSRKPISHSPIKSQSSKKKNNKGETR